MICRNPTILYVFFTLPVNNPDRKKSLTKDKNYYFFLNRNRKRTYNKLLIKWYLIVTAVRKRHLRREELFYYFNLTALTPFDRSKGDLEIQEEEEGLKRSACFVSPARSSLSLLSFFKMYNWFCFSLRVVFFLNISFVDVFRMYRVYV